MIEFATQLEILYQKKTCLFIDVDMLFSTWGSQIRQVGYPWESTRDTNQHMPPTYGLFDGCIGQYRVIFGEQLLEYPPKGTQNFPFL